MSLSPEQSVQQFMAEWEAEQSGAEKAEKASQDSLQFTESEWAKAPCSFKSHGAMSAFTNLSSPGPGAL
jgi:hypothetical protein